MSTTETEVRVHFFDYLFGENKGYVCIATAFPNNKKSFTQQFFKWPEQKANVGSFVDQATHRRNVWFCTSLLELAERKKEFCLPGYLVWADLDSCDPETVEPVPPCIIETSPKRFQALWRLDKVVEPYVQENLSKRIAYKYAPNGADPTGWDLTQLLRVPLTFNYKYEVEEVDVPQVKLLRALDTKVPISLLQELPDVRDKDAEPPISMPDLDTLPEVDKVLYKYHHNLYKTEFSTLYSTTPTDDWSRILWRLINLCLEAGMTKVETFAVTWTAKCNKYLRDDRPPFHLWQDVLRADVGQKKLYLIIGDQYKPFAMPDFNVEKPESNFIEEYKDWAVNATDAVEEFHELSAAILLSSMISQGVELGTSYGPMVPNLWGMILGDSTLTRKTTAMRMAMDVITDVNADLLLATDGSAEGLLTGLSYRPSQVSIFYKDELSGFIDSINRKDYLAGMPETLTQLYDVPRLFTRRLRKETITITSPVFIFFGGGIRDKIHALIDDEYILSGFLPRFLVVAGEANVDNIRRTGPANVTHLSKRADIVENSRRLHGVYTRKTSMQVAGQTVEIDVKVQAQLSDKAWQRYGDIEMEMVKTASSSEIPMLALPTFERLSRSLLKLSILLAAADKDPTDNSFTVDDTYVDQAAYYIQRWGRHTISLLQNAGKGTYERLLERIVKFIKNNPEVGRSRIMQQFHFTKRQMDEVQDTLIERGLVTMKSEGRGKRYMAV